MVSKDAELIKVAAAVMSFHGHHQDAVQLHRIAAAHDRMIAELARRDPQDDVWERGA